MDTNQKRLLAGIRVIDLADEKAAFCGKLLGDLGAEIIKVENPRPDPGRGRPPFIHGPGRTRHRLYFEPYHCNKHLIVLDLKDRADVRKLHRRIKEADIVVESHAPGVMELLGLGFKTLQAKHPELILASITGFGQSGPRRNDLSCDLIAAATGGQAYITGSPNSPPRAPFGEQNYYAASLFAAVGILTALHGRRQTGRGRHIDISLQEAALATLDHVMVRFFHDAVVAGRQDGHHWDGLFALLPCRNGLINLTPTLQWDNLVDWLDSEGMVDDLKAPQWQDATFRSDHMDHILAVLATWTRSHSTEELFELGQLMGLAWAPVASPDQVVASPQLAARKFWQSPAGSGPAADRLYPGPPFQLSPSIADWREKAPSQKCHPGVPLVCAAPAAHPYPLQGLRVLDFTRVLAGPFATRILADFGAQVIKIQTRKGAVGAEDNAGPFFSRWNRNKLGVTLDMNHPEARSLALDLAAVSDVVVENFSPRVMANWGMDYSHLRRIKPDIIMVAMSAMGHTGPWKDHVAFAPTIHSLSGHTWLNGGQGSEPGGLGFAYADIIAGLYGALALLAALDYRRRTGQGQLVDLSEYEAACTLLGPTLLAAQAGQAPAVDCPYAMIPAAPYGCYPCRGQDRWCAIAVLDETQWQALADVLGRPEWMFADRFASMADRKYHAAALDERLGCWTVQQRAEVLEDRLRQAGVPAGVVQTAADLACDPHLAAREVFSSMDHPALGRIWTDRQPIRFVDEHQGPWQPAPLLGKDNAYVFKTLLGLAHDTYEDYCRRGVIG